METGEKIQLPGDWSWWNWKISPDEYWLLDNRITPENPLGLNLQLVSSDGKIENTITWEDGWNYGQWISNEQLLIYKQSDQDVLLFSALELNPFTSDRRELPNDYPDNYAFYGPILSFIPLSYDPSLTKVVYYRSTDLSNPLSEAVLWDVENRQSLAAISVPSEFGFGPRWSPDGAQFVIAGVLPSWSFELFAITRDGLVTQLTHFENADPLVISAERFSWAPDSHSLAFWLLTGTQDAMEEHLATIDLETRTILDYCVSGWFDHPDLVGAPIWSPDGKQLIVESYEPDNMLHAVLVDLELGIAVDLGEQLLPVAWLNETPDVWLK